MDTLKAVLYLFCVVIYKSIIPNFVFYFILTNLTALKVSIFNDFYVYYVPLVDSNSSYCNSFSTLHRNPAYMLAQAVTFSTLALSQSIALGRLENGYKIKN